MTDTQSPTLVDVASVYEVQFPWHKNDMGELAVMQGKAEIPFAISRVFTVVASEGSQRGSHAHRLCSQVMTCSHGAIEVICTDGTKRCSFHLDSPRAGLLVPPSIWSEQRYLEDSSVLLVFCDRPYEEEDYIRNYSEFLKYRTMVIPQ